MTLSLTTRRVEGILVIDLCGKLTIYEEKFREYVRSSLQAGERRLVLRLADLSYLDSAGLGQLVSAYMAFSKEGGDVRLLAPSARTRQLLRMTKLDTVFTILEDETAIRGISEALPVAGSIKAPPDASLLSSFYSADLR